MKLIRTELDLDSGVKIMGVLNVTPDSFSDGGKYIELNAAIDRAFELEQEGADIIDIGGESTRPGSESISLNEELNRVLPVIEALNNKLRIPISIDTTRSEVAAAAIDAGAEIINDISGLRFDPTLADIAREKGGALIVMHSRGTPKDMQKLPFADNIIEEVISTLNNSVNTAVQHGLPKEKIIVDPGIGFGKSPEQNLQLINKLDYIKSELKLPVLLGPSRKSFIKMILEKRMNYDATNDSRIRLAGTSAAVVIGVLRGANIIRVHDVLEMKAVVSLSESILR